MVGRENLAVLKANNKQAKSLKQKWPHTLKLVCMHFIVTSTCMSFLSQLYFLTPMDYSPWFEREFWPNLKCSNISKIEKATPTKLGLHTFHIILYLHELFVLILFFEPMDNNSPWSEREIWPF